MGLPKNVDFFVLENKWPSEMGNQEQNPFFSMVKSLARNTSLCMIKMGLTGYDENRRWRISGINEVLRCWLCYTVAVL